MAVILAEGLSIPATLKYLFCLQNIARWLKKGIAKADKKDIIKVVGELEKTDYSSWTKHAHKVALKKFYKWVSGGEDYPENVKWIKSALSIKNRLPEELLTKDDIEKLIDTAAHPRDKAFISMLYESGCRISEVLSLKMKHVNFDEYGAVMIVDGKTGMRRLRIVTSVPLLATWIENHPMKNTPDAPLWIGIGTRNKDDDIHYPTANRLIKRLAKRAGIKKRVNPHIFRHSRATHLANHFTEAQMNQYFGWVQGSDMPSTYVHLSGRDIDGAVLKLHGLKDGNEIKKEIFSPKKCHRCEKMNPPTGKFCLRCGAPLDLETVMKVEEKRNEMDNIMMTLLKDLLKDPEIQARIENKLEQIKIKSQSG